IRSPVPTSSPIRSPVPTCVHALGATVGDGAEVVAPPHRSIDSRRDPPRATSAAGRLCLTPASSFQVDRAETLELSMSFEAKLWHRRLTPAETQSTGLRSSIQDQLIADQPARRSTKSAWRGNGLITDAIHS